MNKLMTLAVVLGATTAWGREPILVPPAAGAVVYQAPGYSPEPTPLPAAPGTIVVPGEPITSQIQPGTIVCDSCQGVGIPLYHCVKVRQERNIHPCAVPKIVSVPDPCNPCCCVFIEICVPPCGCERVECKRDKITFDYGKYEVDVISRDGYLLVDYDD